MNSRPMMGKLSQRCIRKHYRQIGEGIYVNWMRFFGRLGVERKAVGNYRRASTTTPVGKDRQLHLHSPTFDVHRCLSNGF